MKMQMQEVRKVKVKGMRKVTAIITTQRPAIFMPLLAW